MRYRLKQLFSFFVFCVVIYTSAYATNNEVADYKRIFLPVYKKNGDLVIAIRVLKYNNISSFLVVNPTNLKTQVAPIHDFMSRGQGEKNKPGYFTQRNIASTDYYQLLNRYTAAPYFLNNQGVTNTNHKGNLLTIDLCPSIKPFEQTFFKKLADLSKKTGKPTPIAISISGLWLIQHPEEFAWLLEAKKNHKLDITWVNHSFSHIYYKDLPFSHNFLLSPMTNMDVEILLTEQYLLEAGEMPSVFFRFPGLVSNKTRIKTLKKYGLIPLGADAWLAHHQPITEGGIILVHGNGNEHEGIEAIMPLLEGLSLLNIQQITSANAAVPVQ